MTSFKPRVQYQSESAHRSDNRANRRRFTRLARNLLVACGWAALTVGIGCSTTGGDPAGTGGGSPIAVSGYVLKGSVNGATVHVRKITVTGDIGSVVAGPFTTDATGRWSGEVPGGTAGVHAVTASGGSYTDESTGNTVNLTSDMLGVINVGFGNVGNATPLTHATFINGRYRIQLGASKDAAFSGAIGDMAAALGFDPTSTIPGQSGASASAESSANIDLYNAILGGFSAFLDDNPALSPAFDNAEVWDIVKAVAEDMTDGRLDGIDIAGNGIVVDPDGSGPGTFLPFPPLDANDISNFVDAAVAWAAIHYPNVTIPPIDLTRFGNPIITPGGDWDITGTLTVTGDDAGFFGNTFTPNGVIESIGVNVDGFSFYSDDPSYYVAVGFDSTVPAGKLTGVGAGKMGLLWISDGVLPVPGASISTGPPYTVSFVNVELRELQGNSTLILNGTLTATPR